MSPPMRASRHGALSALRRVRRSGLGGLVGGGSLQAHDGGCGVGIALGGGFFVPSEGDGGVGRNAFTALVAEGEVVLGLG